MLGDASRGLAPNQDPGRIGPRYLVVFSSALVQFRLPEFRAAADFHDLRYAFVPLPVAKQPTLPKTARTDRQEELACDAAESSQRHTVTEDGDGDDACDVVPRGIEVERPLMLVHLENDGAARMLARRVTCIRSIWLHWASGTSMRSIQRSLETDEDVLMDMRPWQESPRSWRANVDGFQRSIPPSERNERIESFQHTLRFVGPIRLKDAELEWCYTEEWTPPRPLPDAEGQQWEQLGRGKSALEGGIYSTAMAQEGSVRKQYQYLNAIHVGRNITPPVHELARDRIHRMDVKKRAYIGNTTMESGMSIVHAVMALAGPGKFVYDPFAGTGSLLLAAAALGATTLASDIDARMMRGKAYNSKNRKLGILRSAEQYGVQDRILDSLCFDVTQHPLHRGALFDAIVADPPYGVRAGAKRLGRRDVYKLRNEPVMLSDGVWAHECDDYYPPKRPYALHDLLVDLFAFATHFLVPGGRLVFWMPTMIEAEEGEDEGEDTGTEVGEDNARGSANGTCKAGKALELQLPPSQHLRLLAHSLQDFGSWGRRLITMEKIDAVDAVAATMQDLRLPPPPSTHQSGSSAVQQDSSSERPYPSDEKQTSSSLRIRATDDPSDFRNQFFAGRLQRMKNASRNPGK